MVSTLCRETSRRKNDWMFDCFWTLTLNRFFVYSRRPVATAAATIHNNMKPQQQQCLMCICTTLTEWVYKIRIPYSHIYNIHIYTRVYSFLTYYYYCYYYYYLLFFFGFFRSHDRSVCRWCISVRGAIYIYIPIHGEYMYSYIGLFVRSVASASFYSFFFCFFAAAKCVEQFCALRFV